MRVAFPLSLCSGIFLTIIVNAAIPPPFGKVLFYLNTARMYNNQYASNEE